MNTQYTGQKISQKRKEKGYTQKDVADALHVSVSAVSKWERGLNYPDLSIVEELARLLDITPAELLGLEGENTDSVIKNIAQITKEEKQREKLASKRRFCILAVSVLLFMIVSWTVLLLGRDDSVMRVFFAVERTGLLTLLPIILGLLAWGVAVFGIFSGREAALWKNCSSLSFLLTSVAVYIPLLTCDLIMRFENYGTVEDTIWGYNFAAAVLIIGSLILNLAAYMIHRKK